MGFDIGNFISKYGVLTASLGANAFFLKWILGLHKEQAEISLFKDSNAKILREKDDHMLQLEEKNRQLEKTISEKCSDEAILSKYERDQVRGIAIHKETKQVYCNSCLNENPPAERMMGKMESGKYWTCTIQGHPTPSVNSQSDDHDHLYDEAIKSIPKNYGIGGI